MECDVVKKIWVYQRCNKMPEMIVGMIETPNAFTIPVDTLNDPALLLEYLNEAAIAPAADAYISGLCLNHLKTFPRKLFTKIRPMPICPSVTVIIVFVFRCVKICVLTKPCIHTGQHKAA